MIAPPTTAGPMSVRAARTTAVAPTDTRLPERRADAKRTCRATSNAAYARAPNAQAPPTTAGQTDPRPSEAMVGSALVAPRTTAAIGPATGAGTRLASAMTRGSPQRR